MPIDNYTEQDEENLRNHFNKLLEYAFDMLKLIPNDSKVIKKYTDFVAGMGKFAGAMNDFNIDNLTYQQTAQQPRPYIYKLKEKTNE